MKLERKEVFTKLVTEDEVDLRQLFRLLWRGRWLVLASALMAAVLGCVVAINIPNQYQVVSVLAQSTENARAGGGLSGIMGELGGLASVAGINLPNSGGGTASALATLQSVDFLSEFIRDQSLKPILFPQWWDADRKAWIPREKPAVLKRLWQSMVDDPQELRIINSPTMEPSDYQAAAFFKEKILLVSQDKRSDLINLTMSWRDPLQAAQWSRELVRRLNARVRQSMMADADKSIAYLRQQAQVTSEVEVRAAIYSLMEAKLKSRMMASVSEDVAFRFADAPMAPTSPSGPKRILIVLGVTLFGSVLAVAWVLLREQLRHL